jgi:hypothetical protein
MLAPILTEGCLLFKKQQTGFYRWYTIQNLPRQTRGAPYNNVKMEFYFYGDKVSAQNDFYKDNQYLMSQTHQVVSNKKNIKPKKY